jgi:hypothetical protein
MVEFKICTKCNDKKEISEFQIKKGKHTSSCKSCVYANHKIWLLNNPEKLKRYRNNSQIWHSKKAEENREKKEKIVLEKKTKNLCRRCGTSLFDRILIAKYCPTCKKKEKNEVWNKNDYIKNKKTYQDYNKKNREKINLRDSKKEKAKREQIADRYVSKLLREKNGYTVAQLKENPELLEIKRILIQTKRLCKTSKN